MVALLQVFLRLLVVAVAAVATWAGVKMELPGFAAPRTPSETAAEESAHAADVFARIEETGIANTPDINPTPAPAPVVRLPQQAATSTPAVKKEERKLAPKDEEAVAPTTPPTVPAAAAPKPAPAPETKKESPAEPTWIETKLPSTLYDPVLGAAEESASKTDDESLARRTTVNLACVRKEGSALRITSGSGIVISPDGLILTDAHVAYFFLLGEDGVGCSITHPSFPIFGYPGQVVYVSPDWVRQNRGVIGGTHTTATGEEDYAFVAFAPGSAPASLGALDYARVSTAEPVAESGDTLTVAGYPGAAASPEGYGSSARLKVDEVNVQDVTSFGSRTADILKTGRTDVAAAGSSGGGAFKNGELVGLTVTVYPTGSGYGINALSTTWINRDLLRDASASIANLIAENPDAAAASFWDAEGEDLADVVRAALD